MGLGGGHLRRYRLADECGSLGHERDVVLVRVPFGQRREPNASLQGSPSPFGRSVVASGFSHSKACSLDSWPLGPTPGVSRRGGVSAGVMVGPRGRNTKEALAEWLKPLAMTERPRGESHIAAWPEGPPLATTERPRCESHIAARLESPPLATTGCPTGERRIAALLESTGSELLECTAVPVGAHLILGTLSTSSMCIRVNACAWGSFET
jgi:hypothetical protein